MTHQTSKETASASQNRAQQLIQQAEQLEHNASRRGSSGVDDRIKAARLREEAENIARKEWAKDCDSINRKINRR